MLRMRMTVVGVLFLLCVSVVCGQDKAYFVDGYHGGVYGHYPDWQAGFMVETLEKVPDWKICLELEPETWDYAKKINEPSYEAFRKTFARLGGTRIEFTNPSYAQPYCYNISGESLIRQFQYGMEMVWDHFPTAKFKTYAVEEPCFTSSLPGVLKSLGFDYAVIRNPNTCWGGYTSAYGGELVNWVGPDGTKMVSVPRYACEGLWADSTWQTDSWGNSPFFIKASFDQGIKHPVGMTYQDAGWRNGPWLSTMAKRHYKPSEYVLWTTYIRDIAGGKTDDDWPFSQEDVKGGLVWGSQVLQKLAQEIRVSENKLQMTEKLAAMAGVYKGQAWPEADVREAWRGVMLSQHHDCWIVPYNGRRGDTWADKVTRWTDKTNELCEGIVDASLNVMCKEQGQGNDYSVRVFNTLAEERTGLVSVMLPEAFGNGMVLVFDEHDKPVLTQVSDDPFMMTRSVIFNATVPGLGYATYTLKAGDAKVRPEVAAKKGNDDTYVLESDLYRLVIDPANGGAIESLVAKTLGGKEFVDADSDEAFGTLRGYFYDDEAMLRSGDSKATVKVLENGPLVASVEIKGQIGEHPFVQVITLAKGDAVIDLDLTINWKGNPGIGAYSQKEGYKAEEYKKAFYDDSKKLLALFPLKLDGQKVTKNAPFDVCESKLEDTFYTSWDTIKHNVILNWVDVTDGDDAYGLAMLSDHTTSYAHGKSHPLGLTVAYSGRALWGRDYRITGPTTMRIGLVPHKGTWQKAGLWSESLAWNEPLVGNVVSGKTDMAARSLVSLNRAGYEVTSMQYDNGKLLVRLFNAEDAGGAVTLVPGFKAGGAKLVELDGRERETLTLSKQRNGRQGVVLKMPQFGVRTVVFDVVQ